MPPKVPGTFVNMMAAHKRFQGRAATDQVRIPST